MKQVVGSYVLACVFWFFLFWPSASHLVNFWLVVSCACVILGGIALVSVRHEAKDIFFSVPGMISHALWDVMIFILLPMK